MGLDEVDCVAFYDKPLLTFDRLLETYFAFAPSGFSSFLTAMPSWLKEKLLLKQQIPKYLNELGRGELEVERLRFGYHHHSHAASAFYPSPYESAAVLVMDGVGEWATTTIGRGHGGAVDLLYEVRFPHSLGLLYAAFTYYLGFKVNDGEYKVMGLAPYGEPRYTGQILEHLMDLKEDGSFRLDLDYFDYCTGLTMTNERFAALFDGKPRRDPESELSQVDMDLARLGAGRDRGGGAAPVPYPHGARPARRNLCLAGGVALNCVANGKRAARRPLRTTSGSSPPPATLAARSAWPLSIAHTVRRRRSSVRACKRYRTGQPCAGSYLGPCFDAASRDAEKALLTPTAPY